MNSLKLNETPVRTSKSFNINNIRISNLEIPKSNVEFANVQVINDSSKIKIEDEQIPINLKYGLGEELTKQVQEQANQNYKITINSKNSKETRYIF